MGVAGGEDMKCKHRDDGHGFYIKLVQSYRQYYTNDGAIDAADSGENSSGARS